MKLDSFYNKNKLYIFCTLILVIFFYSITNFKELIIVATAMIYSTLGIFLVNYIDDKILKVDTKNEISDKKNVAYAIVFLGYCIVVAAGIMSASLIISTLK